MINCKDGNHPATKLVCTEIGMEAICDKHQPRGKRIAASVTISSDEERKTAIQRLLNKVRKP